MSTSAALVVTAAALHARADELARRAHQDKSAHSSGWDDPSGLRDLGDPVLLLIAAEFRALADEIRGGL